MCGNEISTVTAPGQDLRLLVEEQLQKKTIKIDKRRIGENDIRSIQGLDVSKVLVLELTNCMIDDGTVEAISQLGWRNLLKLNLSGNQVGPEGCKTIANSPVFSNIQILELNKNQIKDEGLRRLSQGQFNSHLQDLSINDNSVSDKGISAMSKEFKKLHCLSVGGNLLNDESIEILKQNVNLRELIYLKLSRNKLTDAGIISLLSEGGDLSNLEVLLIERNQIVSTRQELLAAPGISKGLFLFF